MKDKTELYREAVGKQYRIAKRTLLLVYSVLGLVFLVLAACMLAFRVIGDDGFSPAWIFGPMGLFFLVLGVILYFCIPDKPTEKTMERYERRRARFGINYYDIVTELTILRVQVAELEEKVKELEEKK